MKNVHLPKVTTVTYIVDADIELAPYGLIIAS